MNKFNEVYNKLILEKNSNTSENESEFLNNIKKYVSYLNEIKNDEQLGICNNKTYGGYLESVLGFIRGKATKSSAKYFIIKPDVLSSPKYNIKPFHKAEFSEKIFKITKEDYDGTSTFHWECYNGDQENNGNPFVEDGLHESEQTFKSYMDCLNDLKNFVDSGDFMEEYELFDFSRQQIQFKDLVEVHFDNDNED